MESNKNLAECDRQIEELRALLQRQTSGVEELITKGADEIVTALKNGVDIDNWTSPSTAAVQTLRETIQQTERALTTVQKEREELVAAEGAAARLQRWREYLLTALALNVAIDSHHLALITVAEGHRDLVDRIHQAFHACPERRSDFNFEGLQDRLGALNTAEADQLRGNKINPFTGAPVASVLDVGTDLLVMLLGRMPAELRAEFRTEQPAPAPKEKGPEPGSQPAESSAPTEKRTQTRRPPKAAAK
jgi:hypothetical protein